MIETVNTETPYLSSDEVLRISNTTGDEVSYSFGDILKLDREYTFSCWMRADSETTTTVGISTKSETFMLGIEWTQVVFTAMADISSSKEVYFTIPSGTILYAYEGQLEEGTKNSDFSYNPDDILESISIINGKYTALSTSFEVEQGRIEALIQQTTIDGVSLKDRYLETVATVDGISTKVSSIETNFNDLTTRVNSAEQRITDDAIVSTVRSSQLYSADLGEKANSKQIISIINQSAESILINASKINLTGYVTISALQNAGSTVINGSNITTGTISAKRLNLKGLTVNNGSTNTLVVDSSGNVTMNNLVANNGTFSGTVNATKGSIGGFTINEYLSAKGTVTFDFTSSDIEIVKNIILGRTELTDSYLKRYDFNGDGTLKANEALIVDNLVNVSGNKLDTKFIINPTFKTSSNNEPVFAVNVGKRETKITNTGFFYSTGGTFYNLYVNGLSNFYANIYANCGIVLPNENTTEEPDNRLMGTRTDGVLIHLASVSSGNNCVFGYGTYFLEAGSSNYYGNKVALISKNGITADGIQLVLKAGMSLTITYYAGAGHVSNGRQDVVISVPLGRLVDATSVTVNSCFANIRVVGGDYVGEGYVAEGYNYCANSNYTVSATLIKANGCIRLKIHQNTTYGTTTTCPNNSPIAVDILTMKLTFS